VSGPESVRRRVPDDHFSAGNRHRRRQVGNTAFLFAAKSADVEVMRLLVENGADPKMNTLLNITPLMRRCFTHSLDTHSVSLLNSLDILRPTILDSRLQITT